MGTEHRTNAGMHTTLVLTPPIVGLPLIKVVFQHTLGKDATVLISYVALPHKPLATYRLHRVALTQGQLLKTKLGNFHLSSQTQRKINKIRRLRNVSSKRKHSLKTDK